MAQTYDTQLTVPQVAERLGMTADGVYKLIGRGKLDATRLSARKTRVTEAALRRYTERHQDAVRRLREATPEANPEALRQQFTDTTGSTPEQWLQAFKRDELDDTPENMRLLVRAIALRAAANQVRLHHPEVRPWAIPALASARGRG
jgi:excisionase family DNA binding protein